jgi:hypothetical protein
VNSLVYCGPSKTNFTVVSSTASTEVIHSCEAKGCSKVKTTSSAVKGSPSLQVTPDFSVTVSSEPVSSKAKDSPSNGVGSPAAPLL